MRERERAREGGGERQGERACFVLACEQRAAAAVGETNCTHRRGGEVYVQDLRRVLAEPEDALVRHERRAWPTVTLHRLLARVAEVDLRREVREQRDAREVQDELLGALRRDVLLARVAVLAVVVLLRRGERLVALLRQITEITIANHARHVFRVEAAAAPIVDDGLSRRLAHDARHADRNLGAHVARDLGRRLAHSSERGE